MRWCKYFEIVLVGHYEVVPILTLSFIGPPKCCSGADYKVGPVLTISLNGHYIVVPILTISCIGLLIISICFIGKI
jgi:hypothetical protein